MSSSAAPTFEELEDCVRDVIRYMKRLDIPNVGSTKVCVIGGLAMWNYVREHRATMVRVPLEILDHSALFLAFQGLT